MHYDIEVIFPLYDQGFVTSIITNVAGRDSSAGTATRYGLDGPRIEYQ